MSQVVKLILLISIPLLLIGCGPTKKDMITSISGEEFFQNEDNKTDTFYKNLECIKMTEMLVKRTNEIAKEYGDNLSFEQVFYSSTYDNCLWVRVWNFDEGIWRKLYILGDDSGTSYPIEACVKSTEYINEEMNPSGCNSFNEKLQIFKGN